MALRTVYILVASFLLLATVLAWWFRDPAAVPLQDPPAKGSSLAIHPGADDRAASRPGPARPSLRETAGAGSDKTVELLQSLADSSDLDRFDRISLELRSMDLESLRDFCDALSAMPDSSARQWLYRSALYRWGNLDFPSAWEFAEKNSSGDRLYLMERALCGYARVDPDGAWQFYNALLDDPGYSRIQPTSLFGEFSFQDPLDALKKFSGYTAPADDLMRSMWGLYRSVTDPQDYLPMARAAREIESELHASVAKNQLWKGVGQFDTREGLAELAAMESQGMDVEACYSAFFEGWADADGFAALDFIYNNMSEAEQIAYAPIVMKKWAEYGDANIVLQHLNEIPRDNLSDRSIRGIAENLMSLDPLVAMEWAASIESEVIRKDAYSDMAWEWAKIDAGQFQEYMAHLDDAELRSKMAWSAVVAMSTWGILRPESLEIIQYRNTNYRKYTLLKRVVEDTVNPDKFGIYPAPEMVRELERIIRTSDFLKDEYRVELLDALGREP